MLPRQTIPAGPIMLRPPTEADVEPIVRACADPEIVRFIPSVPHPYTREDAFAYLESTSENWAAGGASFSVADAVTGEWLGNIGLRPPVRGGALEVGYLVAPWARGQGVATAATRAVTRWAFTEGAQRVELLAAVDNAASQRVALAAGFQHEGVRRGGEVLRDGSRGDLAAFARLAADPGERITPYLPFPPDGGLCDGTVRLTPMTAEDAADYHRLMADPEVIRFNVPPEPPDAAELLRRCRHTAIWWLTGQRAELAVRDAASGAFAGHVQLTHVAPPIGQAMTGYALLPEHRGRGFATRAVRLLVDWAFAHTPLARVVAGTDPENTASHRVLERAGFTKEALLRGLLPGPDGTRRDDLQWVRLRG